MFSLVIVAAFFVQSSCSVFESKIVGGREVKIFEHPYQVSLQRDGFHNCGGALLKENVVLTAAHCTVNYLNNLKRLTVRAGSTTSQIKNKEPAGGQVATVIQVHQHPKYTDDPLDYDISVINLDRSFTPSENIQTIQLISQNLLIQPGAIGTVTGWGLTNEIGELSRVLRAVDVPSVSKSECNKVYKVISSRMSCYGYPEGGKDACLSDSGGPLVHYINGVPYIAAVVSWGYGCGRPVYPGVYADVQNTELYSYIAAHAGL